MNQLKEDRDVFENLYQTNRTKHGEVDMYKQNFI